MVATGLQAQFSLTIFHNNDGESKLVNAGEGLEDYGGIARFKTLLDSLRLDAAGNGSEHITLSSGDNYLAGTAFTAGLNRPVGQPLYDSEALGAIDYDAICLGNHDFDFGPAVLQRLVTEVNAIQATPFLSSNLDFSGEAGLQALFTGGQIAKSTMINANGNMIGVIGATTTALASISSPGGVVVDANVAAAVQAEVTSLQNNNADLIILISHLQGLEADTALIPMLSGIDIVIAGGGDELLGTPGTPVVPSDTAGGNTFAGPYPLVIEDMNGNDVYMVTTPGEYKYVGRLIVDVDANGNITNVDAASGLVRVAAEDGITEDPTLKTSVVDPIAAYQANLAANVIATSEVDLDGLRNSVRSIETNYGNLIADAMLWQANEEAANFNVPAADVAIQNGGGIRNNTILSAGDYTELATFEALPFSNFVGIVEDITPERFKEIMENSVSALAGGANDGSGRFAQIAGFSIVWDSNATSLEYDIDGNVVTEGERIWSLVLDDNTEIVAEGQIVAGAPNVNLSVVNFTAGGGDQYPLGDLDYTPLGVTYQRALYNYILDELNGTIAAADYPEGGEGRITYKEPVGIADANNAETSVRVYPNPAKEVINVKVSSVENVNTNITITDLSGRMVSSVQGQTGELQQINVSDLNAGVYFIQVEADSMSHVEKIIVE